MNAYTAKALVMATLLLGVAPAYFLTPSGDRWFAVGLWLLFSVIVGILVILKPVLHCPDCGRATRFFVNHAGWSARDPGGFRRHVTCANCGCIMDRLSGDVVGRIPPEEARIANRLVSSIRMRLGLFCVGCALIVGSIGVGTIVVRIVLQGSAHRDRAAIVLLGCGVAFLGGLFSLATSWWLNRKAKRLADEHDIKLRKGIRVRW